MTRASFSHASVIYLVSIWDHNYVKIGYSTSLAARVIDLQSASPFDLCLLYVARGDQHLEHALHTSKELWPHAVRGEWFDLEPARAILLTERAIRKHYKESRQKPPKPLFSALDESTLDGLTPSQIGLGRARDALEAQTRLRLNSATEPLARTLDFLERHEPAQASTPKKPS